MKPIPPPAFLRRLLSRILVSMAMLALACRLPAANILFVVSDPDVTTGGDGAVLNRLQTLGHAVTKADDNGITLAAAAGKDLILISSTVNSVDVGTTFRDTYLPIVVWEPLLFNDMGMTGPANDIDYGSAVGQSQANITAAAHPLAAGLSNGLHAVVSSGQTFTWGVPNNQAVVAATLEGNTNRASIFAYETGAAMPGLSAPGFRVGTYLNNATAGFWNNTGWQLFDAMIAWVLDAGAPPPPPPPPRPPAATRLLPAVEPPGPCSRRTDLVFSEIMYHPVDRVDGKNLEFIEIHNSSPFTQDLGGHRIEGEISFVFPQATTLGPHGRILVAKSPADLAEVTGLTGILGPWNGSLGNGGGELFLHNRAGHILLLLEYSDLPPWPAAADGGGSSLELLRPSYGEESPLAWGASRAVGGTPGLPPDTAWDDLDFLRINEVVVHTDPPLQDFVEILNLHTQAVDVSGLVLTDDPVTNRFVFPAGSVLPGGFHVLLSQTQLGFALSSTGEKLLLMETGTPGRVIDAMAWPAQANGAAYGRFPDGADRIAGLSQFTPTYANDRPALPLVVINELMYAPPSLDRDEQYVELYNRSASPVDLSDWRFTEGITFVFPPGASIPAHGYLVVARNRDRLFARYAQLNGGNTVGNYSGSLRGSGERIVLAKPDDPLLPGQDFVTVDEVSYVDGGQWSGWADKGGSSLELLHPDADNGHPSSWAASDETGKAAWATFATNGVLDDLDSFNVTPNEVQLLLLGEGECLVDNIEILNNSNQNVLANGHFESGVEDWILQGNHEDSRWEPGEGEGGSSASLRLVASGDGDNGVNRAEANLTQALAEGQTVTLRLRARWLRGMPRLLLRVQGNHFELSAPLPLPDTPGTPGLPNSMAAANTGPVLRDLRHFPLLPAAGEDVTVEAVAYDPQGVGDITLHYRQEGLAYSQVSLRDDGVFPDLRAGDSRYAAILPGLGNGKLAEFFAEATDAALPPVVSRFPAGTPALVRFGQSVTTNGDFQALTLWMTQSNLTEWAERQRFSNDMLPGALVLGDHRVIHGAGARYRGSPFIRPNYNGPLGSKIPAYVFRAPKDDPYLGVSAINLDPLEQPERDDTLLRERMTFWLAGRLGQPTVHQRYLHIAINGVPRGVIFADTQQPNRDYLKTIFPDNEGGDFFEVGDWFEFNDVVQRVGNRNARLTPFRDVDNQLAPRRYRWSWQRKDYAGLLADGFAGLFDLVQAFEAPEPAYTEGLLARVDAEEWIAEIALRRAVADWDGYGYNRGKNTHLYRPPGGRWTLLPWDFDFSLGGGSRSPTHDLFAEIEDPVMATFLTRPTFQRIYWRNLIALAEGPMAAAAFEPVSQQIHDVLSSNQIAVVEPSQDLWPWVATRRAFILAAAASNDVSLVILTNGGNDFPTTDNPVTLAGTAPLRAKTLLVNGQELVATWTSPTNWNAQVFLQPGLNVLTLGAIGQDGGALLGEADQISVTFTGEVQNLAGDLKLTEIMYHAPEGPDYDFLEFKNIGTNILDLSGVRVADPGTTYVFPPGASLAPGQHLVLAAEALFFPLKYPDVSFFGELPFNLSNGGETLTVSDPLGQLLFVVPYDDVAPWPTQADGQGYSLVPISPNPTQTLSLASSWQVSCALGGSPGEDDPGNQALAPLWSQEPQDATVTAGSGTSFVAKAFACPPSVYHWFVDGVPQPGENGSTLTLDNLDALDTGAQILAVASNLYGMVTSQVATLLVETELPARVSENLVVYYLFLEGQGSTVADLSGLAPPLDLGFNGGGITWTPGGQGVTIASSSTLAPLGSSAKVHAALTASNAFTLEVWAKAANTTQNGPARLVTYSQGTGARNMTLGQQDADLEFRLRTNDAATSDNGLPATTVTGQVDTSPRQWTVTRAGTTVTVYRDGAGVSTNSVPGNLSNWNNTYEFLLANESSGDRPWLGELQLVALYDRALAPAEVAAHFAIGPDVDGFFVELPDPLVELAPAQDEFLIEWDTFTNAVYRLQWSPEIAPSDWQNLGPAFWGDGMRGGVTVTNAGLDRAFFRALQFPQATP